MRTLYAGTLDRRKMSKEARTAYESYWRQKKTVGVNYSPREFIAWWLENLKTFKGSRATCGRIDHSRPYSWDNIFMQDMSENSREAAIRNRLGDRGRANGQRVIVESPSGEKLAEIASIREAARVFGVSQRAIQFTIRGVFKAPKFTRGLVLKGAA